MRRQWLTILGMGVLVAVTPATAQRPGSLELGAFGRFSSFDSAREFDNTAGISGRLGVFILPRVSLEGDISRSTTEGPSGSSFDYTPMHARLLYNHPVGARTDLLVGAGYALHDYGEYERQPNAEEGLGGLVGLRIGLNDRFAFRLDGTVDFMPATMNSHRGMAVRQPNGRTLIARFESATHVGLQAGVSMMLERGRMRVTTTPMAPQPEPAPEPPPPPPTEERASEPPSPAPRPDDGGAARAREILTEIVHFDFDRFDVRSDAASVLQRKLEVLRANPSVRLRIEGHADERGSSEYNVALGLRRATSVMQYLVASGLDASRFEPASFGEDQPLDQAQSEAAWARNRRAEFRILAGGDGLRMPPQ